MNDIKDLSVEELQAMLAAKQQETDNPIVDSSKQESAIAMENKAVEKEEQSKPIVKNKKKIGIDKIMESVDKAKEQAEKRIAEQKEREQNRADNEYVSMKKFNEKDIEASETTYYIVPMPFYAAKLDSVENFRFVYGGYSIGFNTGERQEDGSPVWKRFSVASNKSWDAFAEKFETPLLTKEQKDIIKNINARLFKLSPYYPAFTDNQRVENLPTDFVNNYQSKIKISYYYDYMYIPGIFLGYKIKSKTSGESSTAKNIFTLFHFNKSSVIQDFLDKLREFRDTDPQFEEKYEQVFNGPDKDGKIKKVLKFKLIHDPSEENSKKKWKKTRLSELEIIDYNPYLFTIDDKTLEVTEEMFKKAEKDLFHDPDLFKVDEFDAKYWEDLSAVLTIAEDYLKKFELFASDVGNNSSGSLIDNGANNSNMPIDNNSIVKGHIDEDENLPDF